MKKLYILLLCLPLLAACSGHGALSEEPDVVADSCVTLAFRFTIPNSSFAGTRGEWTDGDGNTWNDGDSEATKWENYIDIPNGDYRFYVLDLNNRYLFTLAPAPPDIESVVLDHTPTPTAQTYEVRSRLMPSVADRMKGGFKIMMLANWYYGNRTATGEYDAPLNSDFVNGYPVLSENEQISSGNSKFQNSIFTWNHQPLSATHTIPMYGIMTVDAAEAAGLAPCEFFFCGKTLYLLRALVKIEICLSEALKGTFSIKSCYLQNYNGVGFYNPHMDNVNALEDTQSLFNSGNLWLHAYNNAHQGEVIKSGTSFEISSDGSSAIIYTPEYHNNLGGSQADFTTIQGLELSYTIVIDEKEEAGSLKVSDKKLQDYYMGTDTNPFNELHRNHYYRIEITSVSASGEINYTVCHWDEKTAGDITFN